MHFCTYANLLSRLLSRYIQSLLSLRGVVLFCFFLFQARAWVLAQESLETSVSVGGRLHFKHSAMIPPCALLMLQDWLGAGVWELLCVHGHIIASYRLHLSVVCSGLPDQELEKWRLHGMMEGGVMFELSWRPILRLSFLPFFNPFYGSGNWQCSVSLGCLFICDGVRSSALHTWYGAINFGRAWLDYMLIEQTCVVIGFAWRFFGWAHVAFPCFI